MSYYAVSQMARSSALRDRVTSAAAEEGETDPVAWTSQHIFAVVSPSDWVEAWDYAEGAKTTNVNPDTGARDDVINDGMILASVQAVRGAQT